MFAATIGGKTMAPFAARRAEMRNYPERLKLSGVELQRCACIANYPTVTESLTLGTAPSTLPNEAHSYPTHYGSDTQTWTFLVHSVVMG